MVVRLCPFGCPYGCSYGCPFGLWMTLRVFLWAPPNQWYLFSKAPYEVSTGRTEYRFIKSLSGNSLMWQKVFFLPLVQTCVRWPERTFLQLQLFSQKSSDLPPRAKSQEPNIHLASLVALVSLPCDIIICDINAFKFDFEILYSNIGNHIQNILGMSFKLK